MPPVSLTAEEGATPNRYTPDAMERIERLRAEATAFPDETDPRPLTLGEIRLARGTSLAALEKAALFARAAPHVGPGGNEADLFRDAIAFEIAYGGVRDEALAVARRTDHAILRKKLKAVLAVRVLYRMAKGYVTCNAGDIVKTHLAEMKRTLVRPRRRKAAAPAEQPEEVKAAK